MLSASTSMPCASIAAMRVLVSCISNPGASSGWLITAAAAGTMQWACTSMVLTRLPLTTTSRRRDWGCDVGFGATLEIAQGIKARAARVLVSRSPVMGISIALSCVVGQWARLLRPIARSAQPVGVLPVFQGTLSGTPGRGAAVERGLFGGGGAGGDALECVP